MYKSYLSFFTKRIFSLLTVLVLLLSPLAVSAKTFNPAPPESPLYSLTVSIHETPIPSPLAIEDPDNSAQYIAQFDTSSIILTPGTTISKVWVKIKFHKTDNVDCAPPSGGTMDYGGQFRATLYSPGHLESANLIGPGPFESFANTGPNPNSGPTWITFDDELGTSNVWGQSIPSTPTTYQTSYMELIDFKGMDFTGIWELVLKEEYWDAEYPHALCYYESELNFDFDMFDLTIEKYPSTASGEYYNGPIMAGQEMFWTIRGRNNGPDPATNPVVYDYLPREFILLGTEPSWERTDPQPEPPPDMPDFGTWYTFHIGDIPPDGEYEFHVKTLVSPDAVSYTNMGTMTLNNYARIEANGIDEEPYNNQNWSAPVFIEDLADLRVTKMSKPDTLVQAGEPFTYTIFVDNLGPSFARYVFIQDKILSSGDFDLVSFHSNRDVDCDINDEGFDCLLWDPLEPQGYFLEFPPSERWTIQVEALANETQDINNEVNVFTIDSPLEGIRGTPDPDLSNNQAIDFISVLDTSDLSLTKEAEVELWNGGDWSDEDPATAGRRIHYTLYVHNNGPSTAENVVIEDWLPPEVEIVDVYGEKPDESPASCLTGVPGDPTQPATCAFGSLAPDETGYMHIWVKVKPDVALPGKTSSEIHNNARAYSDIFDPDNSNDYAHLETGVQGVADLSLYKAAMPPETWISGGQFTYRLDIDNWGPSTAKTTILYEELPEEVEFLGARIFSWGEEERPLTCTWDLPPVAPMQEDQSLALYCPLGDLPPNASMTVFLDIRVKENVQGSITNEAWVWSETYDPNEEFNWSEVETEVDAFLDLALEKSAPEHIYAGQEMFYDLTVTNVGATTTVSEEVQVWDGLPYYQVDEWGIAVPLVYYLGSTGDVDQHGDHCEHNSVTLEVSCWIPGLAPGESYFYQIKVLVRPDLLEVVEEAGADGTYEMINEAWLKIDDVDQDVTTAITVVEDQADLRVTKMSKPDTEVRAGDYFTYTIFVDNLGPSSSRGIVVQDNILSSGDFTVIDVIDDRSMLAPDGSQPNNGGDWTSYNCLTDDGGPVGPDSPDASLIIECTYPEDQALEPQGWYPQEWNPPSMPRGRAPLQGELLSGRWTIQIVVQANETQDVNNVVDVFTVNEYDPEYGIFRGTPDPDLSNNQAIDFISVLDSSDLELTKAVAGEIKWGETFIISDTQVSFGLPLTYTLIITNNGASTAENIVLQDNLPVELDIRRITPSQGRCLRGIPGNLSKPMTCNLGTLAPGNALTVTVVTLVPEDTPVGTMIYNEAWIFDDIFDPDNSNNIDARYTEVVQQYNGILFLPIVLD